MEIRGRVVVVTGGARGIGAALAARFVREGARATVIADRLETGSETAASLGAEFHLVDVADEAQVAGLVDEVEGRLGPIDLFCSNAGVFIPGDIAGPLEAWERAFDVNFRAHLYAARALVPRMIARGGGGLLQVVSAAGLLTQLGSPTYAVSKHAALALAEWLATTYGDRGLRVSCVCPLGVKTAMLAGEEDPVRSFLLDGAAEPEQVADAVMAGLAEERFLILPHPEVAEYFRRKADDYDRWLRGMRRLQARLAETHG